MVRERPVDTSPLSPWDTSTTGPRSSRPFSRRRGRRGPRLLSISGGTLRGRILPDERLPDSSVGVFAGRPLRSLSHSLRRSGHVVARRHELPPPLPLSPRLLLLPDRAGGKPHRPRSMPL